MIKLKIAAVAAWLVPVVTMAAETAPVPVFPAERLRAHVEFLADDLLEGRKTGTRGHEVAASYVASQFAAAGLQPCGDNGTWYQRITFQRTERGADPGSITIGGPAGERTFAHAGDVLVGLNPLELELDLAAPLVFVGYGIVDSHFGLDDYRGLDVRGKIVVALRGFPKGLPSEEGAHMAAIKAEVAEERGAIGMLSIGTLQSDKAVPWSRRLEYANDPGFAWVRPDGRVHQDAPAIRASGALNGAAAAAVFAGSARTLAQIHAEADRPKAAPRGFVLKTRAQVRARGTAQRVSSPNVIALLPGSDPRLASEYVVLLAHLDHLGINAPALGDKPEADRINNGALDNAAGVATLLEVARAAAAAPDKPRRSILFLATTAEENGLLGADYFARNPTVPIGQIVGNVGLDMPLLLYPFTDVIAFGATHSSFAQLVADAVAPMNVTLAPDPMPEQGVFTRSDHYMLVKQGVPAVFFVTGHGNGGDEHWGKFLSGAYHRPNDDLSQPIHWAAAARFAEANYRIVRGMADGDTAPRWNAGDYFSAPRGKK